MIKTAPRISRVSRKDAADSTAEIYDRYMRTRGNVPNMFRTLAHRPQILQTAIAHMEAILTTGTLPTRLKELAIVRTSQLNGCDYCLASHTQICLRLGWTQEQIDGIADFVGSDLFTPAEKAALRLAEQMTNNSAGVTDSEFASLREFYEEGELVELMAAIGLFNYFNRFNNVLQLEPTQPGEGNN
jgi:uncharacterized peroxidase-related enzyme